MASYIASYVIQACSLLYDATVDRSVIICTYIANYLIINIHDKF